MAEVLLSDKDVTLLRTKMRYVYLRRGIVREHSQNLPWRQCHKTLSRFQNRQRAKQPQCIQFGIPHHLQLP